MDICGGKSDKKGGTARAFHLLDASAKVSLPKFEPYSVRRGIRRISGMVRVRRGSQLRGNTLFLQYCIATKSTSLSFTRAVLTTRNIIMIGNRTLRRTTFHLVEKFVTKGSTPIEAFSIQLTVPIAGIVRGDRE